VETEKLADSMSCMEPFGTTVLAESVAVKLPAWLDTLLAKRAVSRYDQTV
jgi:hypothetical protein